MNLLGANGEMVDLIQSDFTHDQDSESKALPPVFCTGCAPILGAGDPVEEALVVGTIVAIGIIVAIG